MSPSLIPSRPSLPRARRGSLRRWPRRPSQRGARASTLRRPSGRLPADRTSPLASEGADMPRQPEPVRLTVTRYVDAKGRQVKKTTPGAKKVTTRTEEYYARVGPKKNGRHQPVSIGT